MTRLFGFVQLDLAGVLALADGRYVLRDGERERVLVIETLGAQLAAPRHRRRPRRASAAEPPASLPLTRVTLVRAFEEFGDEPQARAWLDSTGGEEDALGRALEEALADLNRALHAHAVAGGDPHPQRFALERVAATRIGYGSGEELAGGAFTSAQSADPPRGSGSRRQARAEELRPQRRLAAVLGDRERLDACETLLLRARADLDAGRVREAALQLRIGLEALLGELDGALEDPGHRDDMAALRERRRELDGLATAALAGELDGDRLTALKELLALGERVLRRRRILSG